MLDLTPAGATRNPARAVDGPVLYTPNDVWAIYRLAPVHLDYLTPAEQEQQAVGTATAWSGLAGRDVHLMSTVEPVDPGPWADRLAADSWDLGEGWPEWNGRAVAHLHRRADQTKAVYVAVRLGDRRKPLLGRRLSALFADLDLRAGVANTTVTATELDRWQRAARAVGRPLTDAGLAASATAVEVIRLVRNAVLRGHPDPNNDRRRTWGPGELSAVLEGTLTRGPNWVRSDGPDGTSRFHATLTVARMPDPYRWPPGAPWLCLHEWVNGHVEVSARWRIVGWQDATKDVANKVAIAKDQERHTRQAGKDPSDQDLQMVATATRLEGQLADTRESLVYAHTRLVCTADTPEQLDELVEEVVEHYRNTADILLARPSLDQWPLAQETRPGGKVEVQSYRQQHDMATVGMSIPQAATDVGDGHGPYLGYTTGVLTPVPVMFDLWEATRRKKRQRATTVAVTGSLGGGKTVTLMRLIRDAMQQAARVVAFDPKGDLARLAGIEGAVDVLDLTSAPDGILDPFRLIDDRDTAKMVALEVIDRLMPGHLQPAHRTAIHQAVQAVANGPAPSLSAVVDRLEDGNDAAREVWSTLDIYRTLPLARLAFQPYDGEDVQLGDGLTVITTPGVVYPTAGTKLADMSWPERLAVTAIYLVGSYARRVALHAEPDRPKLIVLDEAWALAATDQGRALIDETSRMGRSRNAALVLASQSALDLDYPELVNCISTVLSHRIGSDREGEAVARLLGVEPSRTLTIDLYALDAGECVMRDVDNRVGRMQVDIEWDAALAALLDHYESEPERVPA